MFRHLYFVCRALDLISVFSVFAGKFALRLAEFVVYSSVFEPPLKSPQYQAQALFLSSRFRNRVAASLVCPSGIPGGVGNKVP